MALLNAITVRLIYSLNTGIIRTEFHVVYDSYFDMVNSNNEKPPEIWTELITLNYFRLKYNDEDYILELDR